MALVKLLLQYPFSPDGLFWTVHEYPNPSWETVVSLIQNIDGVILRDCYLLIDTSDLEHPIHQLNIEGANDEFLIQYFSENNTNPNDDFVTYFDSSRPAKEILFCNQYGSNFFYSLQNLCNDRQRVLDIAQHFFLTGEAYPNVIWKSWL